MIIPLDKPKGPTSQSVISKIKDRFKRNGLVVKTGYSGTLDPICTGVLPVLTDRSTRIADFLHTDKRYIAGFRPGIVTDSFDITGKVIEKKDAHLSEKDIKDAIPSFIGNIDQVPPIYSAIKVNGKKLYDYARKGQEIEISSRRVEIYSIDVIPSQDEGEFLLDVYCSAGTYIRSLCNDLGRALGTGGCMTSLRRTFAANISEKDCHPLDIVLEKIDDGSIEDIALSNEYALDHYEKVTIDISAERYFLNGGIINPERIYGIKGEEGKIFRVYSQNECFIGMGKNVPQGFKCVWRND